MNYSKKKEELTKQFTDLQEEQGKLVTKVNEINAELLRIQGEYRLLESLEKGK